MTSGPDHMIDRFGMSMKRDSENGFALCKQILASSDEEFSSRAWLLETARKYGLAYSRLPLFEPFADWKNSSEFGLLQFPTEFIDFVQELARVKPADGVEIGVYKGATAYFIAAVLQRANRDFEYHLVDIADDCVEFEKFATILNLVKHIPATSNDLSGREFDFVFIDADHSYHWSTRDYLNVGRYARKCVAFHDVCGHEFDSEDGGIVRTWREFKTSNRLTMRIMEFSHSTTPWMGIGLGVR